MAFLILGCATSIFAQNISVGFKGGVPLTDVVKTDGAPFWAQTKSYTVGPVVNVGLPHGFGIEIGAMYKRVPQQAQQATVIGLQPPNPDPDSEDPGGGPILQWYNVSAVGRSWEFPIAGQYHFSLLSAHPYVETGFAYNLLSNIYHGYNPPPAGPLQFPTVFVTPNTKTLDRRGFLLGGGLEFKWEKIRMSPGIRYARYKSKFGASLPGPNVLDFLVGFSFNAVHNNQ